MPPLRLRPSVTAAVLGLAVCAAASAAPVVHGPRPGTGCGGTLWRLMTLSDAGRMSVELERRPTTIAEIADRARPDEIGPMRATPFQRQVWGLRAVVDRYRIASNGEIVLILYSIETGQFMNAYLPASQCLGPRARDRTGMLAARRELTVRCPHVTSGWQLLGVTVDVAGVGFWNPSTATRGALPNGAELRPVTNLRVVSGCGVN
ncbi:MAG TPA: hypothetical protein VFA56_04560 [Gaiellaceae bacterium]|nr:hypothetical protein [Gaiellaceae bacterium]